MLERTTGAWYVLFAAVGVLLVFCASASAAVLHPFESSFDGSDAPGGPFAVLTGMAVDSSGGPANGDVYVADFSFEQGGVVDRFHEDGSYAGVRITGAETPQGSLSLLSFANGTAGGVAVDGSGGVNRGDVYVADVGNGVVDRFSESGHYLCQITAAATPSVSECNGVAGSETPRGAFEPTGVAVDASGNVYVADYAGSVVDVFAPSGGYSRQIAGSHISNPDRVAVDAGGDVYVANELRDVAKFDAGGSFVSILDSTPSVGVAVDPATGHVDVFEEPGQLIAEYDAAGTLIDHFGAGYFQRNAFALAVGVTGKIYASAGPLFGGAVDIFSAAIVSPSVSTGTASEVQQATATLNGHVDPDTAHGGGEVTECRFEYGTTTSYGQTAACVPGTPYATATDASAPITGLTADTTYHFRLVAANATIGGEGGDQSFTTRGAPSIDGQSATVVTTSGTARAQIDSFGYDTTCEVQYVTEAEYQSSQYAAARTTPCTAALPAGFGDQSATAALAGLRVDTVYHYRFLASNQAATVTGADQTLATFGIRSFAMGMFDEAGHPYTQAGGHPYAMTTTFSFNTSTTVFGETGTDASPRRIEVELPRGMMGNPEATPKCSPYNVAHADCGGATQVGILKVVGSHVSSLQESPLYNLVPPKGVAAQFGARFNGFVTAHIDSKLRTGGDYGITADSLEVSTGEGILGVSVTTWGVPADPSHDPERYCPVPGEINESTPCPSGAPLVPFLTSSTACSQPQTATVRADSWQEPGAFVSATTGMPGITGCERLEFRPALTVRPESTVADSPTGLHVDLHIPQNESPTGLAEANLKDAVVTLPAGVTVNPAAAAGLEGCSAAQIELHGPEPARCPDASKIGTVEVLTPIIGHPLDGSVYVAKQAENPFGSLLALYIAIDDPQTGVVIKVAGQVMLDPETGRLTTVFDENPQQPFEDLKLDFFGGPRAPLTTPPACGTYTTTSVLTPWSAPESGPAATPGDSFQIASTPGGGCAPAGFVPSFTAGTTSNQAGAFSPFSMTLSRSDRDQTFGGVTLQTPPGLLGALESVPLCGEPQAAQGTCSSASQIGHTTVGAGVGSDPVFLPQAGRQEDPVYLTGPYKGAPFGLSIVEHAEAGPFNLGPEGGKPIVVRAAIDVDPHTAQITVVSDELPHILQGIPLQVRTINVAIDRSGFIFNPTNCSPLSVGGTVASVQGASTGVSSAFQVANCANLPFKPGFAASTAGKTSKANGASLVVKVTSKGGPQAGGGEANIAKVRVTLPKQLPARLTTLQKACTEAQFNANPAGCPAASAVGTATAITPVLAHPLTGPAYLVSHGGAAFPDLVFVLQGEGITLYLDGNTNIKKGITTSTFNSVPDAPISSFTTVFPQGPHSVLATNIPAKAKNSMCAQKLTMPTTITAQNGAVSTQNTKIAVTGCPKSKKATTHRKHKRRAKGHRHGKKG
jgi:hypothetical protein